MTPTIEECLAEMEVDRFVGGIIGINTAFEIFMPMGRSDDLNRIEHWMIDNNVAYTVSRTPKKDCDGLFEVYMGWEDYEDLIRVVHKDKAIAFITAFCLLHNDPGLGFVRCYNDIEYEIKEDDSDV